MAESTDPAPDDPEIPDEYPSAEGAEPELDDQPLGPPADADPDEAPLPGIPDGREPPSAG